MPKNKTHSGIKKRVKVTGSGKLLHASTPACATTSSASRRTLTRRLTGTEESPRPTPRASRSCSVADRSPRSHRPSGSGRPEHHEELPWHASSGQ